jgi:hypothetical protein
MNEFSNMMVDLRLDIVKYYLLLDLLLDSEDGDDISLRNVR